MKRVFKVATELKEMKRWLAAPKQEAFQWGDARRNIANALAKPHERTITAFRAELGQIHAWKATQGCVAVLDGDAAGWRDVSHGLAFACCDVQIALGMFLDHGLPKGGALCDVEYPLILAAAIVLRQDGFADWCGRVFVDSFLTGRGAFRDWKLTPLSPFLTRLYARWRGLDVSSTPVRRSLGPYAGLLTHWDNAKKLTSVLAKACDYHVQNSVYTERSVTEFDETPFDVWPVEILAYLRVRQDLGLATPLPAHPLLGTPLVQVLEQMPKINDELLDRVTAFILAQLPSTRNVRA